MKQILMITYDQFDDSEVLYPLNRLREESWQVDVASMEQRIIKAKYHYDVQADLTLAETDPDRYDGLVLPGGAAPEKLRQDADALRIVRRFFTDNSPIGAICHGPLILISAGVLKGRRCTCYPGIRDDLINAGGGYENAPVVTDGNLITSRRPEDLPDFMREFIKAINQN